MKIHSALLTLFTITFLFACEYTIPLDNEKAIKKSIKNVLHEQVAAWNDGKIDRFMAHYWQSDSLRFASGGEVTYGWTTTLQRYKKAYPDKATMGILTFEIYEITVLSNKSAIAFGRWLLQRQTDKPSGLFTLTFREKKDRWVIVHDHTSSAKN